MRRCLILILIISACVLVHGIASPAAPFYEGRTIRLLVGVAAGGGYDAYARVIARHMGKYISGNPTIIVDNMTGAGGLILANYLYKVAKPDGLTIGHFNGGFFFGQAIGQQGIEFEAQKFVFIGAPAKEDTVCFFTKLSAITSMEKWAAAKPPPKMGGDSPGAFAPDGVIRVLEYALGLPVQLVSGYKGQAPIRMAIESGELHGSARNWYAMRSSMGRALTAGDLVVVLQNVPKPFPDLPNVPTAISLAKTEEARQLIEVYIHSNSVFARPFALPPGVPSDRVMLLRNAFSETLRDKDLIAEIEKMRLEIDAITAEELEKTVARIFKIDTPLLNKLKQIVFK